MITILKSIVKFFTHHDEGDSKKVTISRLVILGTIGVLLILLSHFFSNDETENINPPPVMPPNDTEDHQAGSSKVDDEILVMEKRYKQELELMIDSIEGVSDAQVMVNLESTGEQVYEKNVITGTQSTVETDQEGGTRNIEDHTEENQVVIIRQGEKEIPLIAHSKKPTVRGVLVTANGVDTAKKQQLVLDAVSKVLDVGAHRISIMPRDRGDQ